MRQRPNFLAGGLSVVWLAIIVIPLLVLLQASFETQQGYGTSGALGLATTFTFGNYINAFSLGFGTYFLNTIIVTVSVIAIVLVLVPPLSYAIVRNQGRVTGLIFRIFLLGLAIPAQAVIVPIFYLISKAGLYDNLIGVILPSAAFCLPVCTLILSGSMRDITPELYEAMAVDGATPGRSFFQLVLPLSKSGISTIVVFSALQAWNGFLFPLILTQSDSNRVVTLGLFNFQSQFGINIPGLLAAVTMSTIPILLVYLFARRALVQGLMGVGGK
jgi:xylobiose transport system permease protein